MTRYRVTDGEGNVSRVYVTKREALIALGRWLLNSDRAFLQQQEALNNGDWMTVGGAWVDPKINQ